MGEAVAVTDAELDEVIRGWRRRLCTGDWRWKPPKVIRASRPVYDALRRRVDRVLADGVLGSDLGEGVVFRRIPVEPETDQ